MRRRVTFPLSAGVPLAMPPLAFGETFDVLLFGAGANPAFTEDGDWVVVEISGPLQQYASWFGDSYEAIRGRVREALEKSTKKNFALRIDSPGGSYAGALELAREIRGMLEGAKIRKSATFVESYAHSAGYALACATDEIVITPSASVGSVGVWSALVDITAADKANGMNFVIVASDAHKADRNPHVKIADETIDRMQAEVDDMAGMFRAAAADLRGRGMTPDKFKALKGAAFFGAKAASLGLADKIVDSWGEFTKGSKGEKKMSAYTKAAMQKAADEGDADAKAMLATLAKAESDEKPEKAKEEKACGKCGKAHASDAKCQKAEKAKAKDDDGDEDDDKDDGKKALALAEETRALVMKGEERRERAELFASREDWGDEEKKLYANAPIDFLRDLVKNSPKKEKPAAANGGPGRFANAGNATPASAQAPGEGAFVAMSAAENEALARMGAGGPTVSFALGCGDPEAARRFLKKQEDDAKTAAAAKGGA